MHVFVQQDEKGRPRHEGSYIGAVYSGCQRNDCYTAVATAQESRIPNYTLPAKRKFDPGLCEFVQADSRFMCPMRLINSYKFTDRRE